VQIVPVKSLRDAPLLKVEKIEPQQVGVPPLSSAAPVQQSYRASAIPPPFSGNWFTPAHGSHWPESGTVTVLVDWG
jgi:hypothetical protein